jgi:hypothetical protein
MAGDNLGFLLYGGWSRRSICIIRMYRALQVK